MMNKLTQILKNRKKILGQNSRNLDYVKKYGNARGRRIADDKLMTKEILQKEDISVPSLLGVINDYKELQEFDWDTLPSSFVMKPVHGLEGKGIEIFYNRDKDGNWIRGDKSKASISNLKQLASDILVGKYAIAGSTDKVFFEERIRTHKSLLNYAYKGTPDIRIIIFNKIPIMAYARFPTKESEGKANMKIGAVGTGIDLATGITTFSTYGKALGGKGFPIDHIPGTKLSYQGLEIPYWNDLLTHAIKAQSVSGLKYVAIDFLIDQDKGPMIVELNARPGLSIQLANRAGLAWRLEKARGLKANSTLKGIRIGKELFGGEVEEKIEKISGKELISNLMPVKLMSDNAKTQSLALIDTSRRTTIIDSKTAIALDLIDEKIPDGEYEIENIKIKLGNQTFESEVRIVRDQIKGHRVLIGRRDLGNYIIDIKKFDREPEKQLRDQVIAERSRTSFKQLDKALSEIAKQTPLLPALRPINLETEKEKFFALKCEYNPIFEYKPIKFNPDFLFVQLNFLNPPDNEMGKLYEDKILEMKRNILLIESIGQDPKVFTERSIKLFGRPKIKYVNQAKRLLENMKEPAEDNSKKLTIEQVEKQVSEYLEKYDIKSKIIITDGETPTKAAIGKRTGKITLNSNYKWTQDTLNGTLAHEIGTHLARRKNGMLQEYGIFKLGTAGYLPSEEGLATIMKYISTKDNQMFVPALTYASMILALRGSFIDVYNFLRNYVNEEKSFSIAYRTKRGIEDTSQKGAFTKDQYFGWAFATGNFILKEPKSLFYLQNGKAKAAELIKYTKRSTNKTPINLSDLKSFLDSNRIIDTNSK